jgi:Transposase DDE domain
METTSVLCTILAQMPCISNSFKRFLVDLVLIFLSVKGRFNFRNVSRWGWYEEHSLSRNFNQSFDFQLFNELFIAKYLASDTKIAALDCTFIKKSGKGTAGLDKFYRAESEKCVQGLELSVLSLISVEKRTGFALQVRQTVAGLGQENKKSFYAEQIGLVQAFLSRMGVGYLTADNLYASELWINKLSGYNLHLISKLRKDANCKYLYEGLQSGKGRPKTYAGKVRWETAAEQMRFAGTTPQGENLYEKVLYSVALKQIIKVVLVEKVRKDGKRGHCILFSTDLEQAAQEIYDYYELRFQIEFQFRDAKQHLGLEHCQSRQAQKLQFHFNFVFLLLNLAKWELISQGQKVLSIADLKCAYFNRNWIKTILQTMHIDFELIKNKPNIQQLLNWGIINP